MTAIFYLLAFLIGTAFAQATMIEDYLKAMQERRFSNEDDTRDLAEPQFIKNTQWNLKEKGYYTGETDGVYREAFQNAVASCIKDEKCKSPVFAWTFETSPDRP
jgi:hypothetical protein